MERTEHSTPAVMTVRDGSLCPVVEFSSRDLPQQGLLDFPNPLDSPIWNLESSGFLTKLTELALNFE